MISQQADTEILIRIELDINILLILATVNARRPNIANVIFFQSKINYRIYMKR